MRPQADARATRLFLDLTQDWAHALGYQIYQIDSCEGAHPGIGVVEQYG